MIHDLRREHILATGLLLALLALPRPVAAQQAADLVITKSDGVAEVRVGDTVRYTIVVVNAGPAAASGVSVTDTFPAALTGCSTRSVASGGATGHTTEIDGNISDSGLQLPAGGSVTYTATCTVASRGDGTLSNTATVSLTGDPNPANNAASDATAIGEGEADPFDSSGGGCATAGARSSALALLLPAGAWLALRRRRASAPRA